MTALLNEKSGLSLQCTFKDNDFEGPGGLPCHFDWDSEPRPVNQRTGKFLKAKPLPKRCTKACRQYSAPDAFDLDSIPPYTDDEIMAIELEMLGMYLSRSPFDSLDPQDREALRTDAEQILL